MNFRPKVFPFIILNRDKRNLTRYVEPLCPEIHLRYNIINYMQFYSVKVKFSNKFVAKRSKLF